MGDRGNKNQELRINRKITQLKTNEVEGTLERKHKKKHCMSCMRHFK